MATERKVRVRLEANVASYIASMKAAEAATRSTFREIDQSIDKTNDRTAWLAQGILAIGPTLAPLGAAAIPVLSGLATQMTVAAGAAGVMALGFNGVGDSLKALNDFQLEPTKANLEKMQEAMAKIGPEGAQFVKFLDHVGSELSVLADDARGGMFPGFTEGIESAMELLPRFRDIVTDIAEGIGDLASEAGAGLAGPEFEDFFDFLERDAKPILVEMGRTLGNFIDGFASMIVAFAPLSNDFSTGFLNMSRDFEEWAEGLSSSASFAEFVEYIQQSIPMVTEFLGELTDAMVSILKAAAPVGDVMLPMLGNMLKLVGQLADTPLGPMFLTAAAALSVYGRAAALASITTGGLFGKLAGGTAVVKTFQSTAVTGLTGDLRAMRGEFASVGAAQAVMLSGMSNTTGAAQRTRGALRTLGPAFGQAAAGAGILAVAMTDVDDKVGLSNTAMGALIGQMVKGGGLGFAIGATIGLSQDLAAANDDVMNSFKGVDAAVNSMDLNNARTQLELAGRAVEDYKERVDVGTWELPSPGDILPSIKNNWESAFGKPDDEEQADKWASTAAGIKMMEEAAAGLASTLGIAIGPIDGTARSTNELNEVLAKAAPMMRTAGISAEELRTAVIATKLTGDSTTLDALLARIAAEAPKAASGVNTYSTAAERAQVRADRMREALQASRQAARETARGFIGLGSSLNDSEKSLGQWLRELEKQNQALRNFRLNAEKAAENGLRKGLIAALQAAGPEGALRLQQLANASKKEIGRANEAWESGQREIKRYTNAVGGVPTDHTTTIHTNTLDGLVKLTEYKRRLDAIKSKVITLRLDRVGADPSMGAPSITPADGTTVPGPRFPYGDKIPALLAPGEEVISNRFGQADRNRALLKAINSNRMADGGTTGIGTAASYSAVRDTSGMSTGYVLGLIKLGHVSEQVAKGLLAEEKIRTRISENELARAEKSVEREKSQLEAIKSAQKAFEDALSSRLTSDVFGGASAASGSMDYTFARPEGFENWAPDQQAAAMQEARDRWLATITTAQSPNDILRGDIKDIKAYTNLLDQLRALGLDGEAFQYASTDASLSELQSLLAGGRKEVNDYERLYERRGNLIESTAGRFGQAEFGSAVAAQTAATREAVVELKAATIEAKAQTKILQKLTDAVEDAPRETGREVGKAIRGEVTTGARGRRG